VSSADRPSLLAVTGTPGTGKTTATTQLESSYRVIHLTEILREEGLFTDRDEARDSLVADMDALEAAIDSRVQEYDPDETVILESHLAHHLASDRVVVLRCEPAQLAARLESRGEPPAKAEENAACEALDLVLSEAVKRVGLDSVYEIDTTDQSPERVGAEIERVVTGKRAPSAGTVSFEARV